MADDKIIDFASKKAEGIMNNKKENDGKDSDQSVVTVGLKEQKVMKINAFRNGETVELDPSKVDPKTTIEVTNPEVDACIDAFCEEKNDKNLSALMRQLETARVLLPGQLMGEKNVPVPLTLNTKDGEILQPVFTDKEKIAAAPKSQIVLNLPFPIVVAQVIEKGPDIAGVVINPFGKAVILKREILEKMMEIIKAKAMSIQAAQKEQIVPGVENGKVVMRGDGTTSTKLALTEEEFNVLERLKFEKEVLPQALHKKGDIFVDELIEKREEYIDHLFEQSYIEKRIYPYLQDEFKVMPMGISEDMELITITMPKSFVRPGVAEIIYMVWNRKTNKGRYIAFIHGKGKDRSVLEISKDGKAITLGEAPEEGTEINWLLEQINGKGEA